jgi:hypothetical protein
MKPSRLQRLKAQRDEAVAEAARVKARLEAVREAAEDVFDAAPLHKRQVVRQALTPILELLLDEVSDG